MTYRWNTKDSVLEDALEAVIGAVYLDRGLVMARTFIINLIEKYVDKKDLLENNNFKDILIQWCRAQGEPLPSFESNRVASAAHGGKLVYDTAVTVKGVTGRGVDASKKKSEMKAARLVILELRIPVQK